MKKGRVRVQLDLPVEVVRQIDEIREALGLGSRTAAIVFALALMNIACEEKKSGGRVVVERDEQRRELLLPAMAG